MICTKNVYHQEINDCNKKYKSNNEINYFSSVQFYK